MDHQFELRWGQLFVLPFDGGRCCGRWQGKYIGQARVTDKKPTLVYQGMTT